MKINNKRMAFLSVACLLLAALMALTCAKPASGQKRAESNTSAASRAAVDAKQSAANDPVLSAMREELERSKSHVKMDNVSAPYYIEYRLSDVEEYTAEATFGALRENQRVHVRSIRVVVRVGDYKQDSYYGPGIGVVDLAPLDNDSIALRRQLWNATDRAYKAASEAFASKKALLSQYSAEQPFDDFSKAPSLQSIGPTGQTRIFARGVETGA